VENKWNIYNFRPNKDKLVYLQLGVIKDFDFLELHSGPRALPDEAPSCLQPGF